MTKCLTFLDAYSCSKWPILSLTVHYCNKKVNRCHSAKRTTEMLSIAFVKRTLHSFNVFGLNIFTSTCFVIVVPHIMSISSHGGPYGGALLWPLFWFFRYGFFFCLLNNCVFLWFTFLLTNSTSITQWGVFFMFHSPFFDICFISIYYMWSFYAFVYTRIFMTSVLKKILLIEWLIHFLKVLTNNFSN